MTERCPEVSNNHTVRCLHDVGHEGSHWGQTDDGKDVVWLSITLKPPGK